MGGEEALKALKPIKSYIKNTELLLVEEANEYFHVSSKTTKEYLDIPVPQIWMEKTSPFLEIQKLFL